MNSRLWLPAAAISSARLAWDWHHILQIRHIGQGVRGLGLRQRQFVLTRQPGGDGQQLVGGAHLGILDEGGLGAVLSRHQQGATRIAAGEHGGQHPEHGTDLAGQGKLP